MSQLLKFNRSFLPLSSRYLLCGTNKPIKTIVPFLQPHYQTRSSSNSSKPPEQEKGAVKDDIKYTVRFSKNNYLDVKDAFKKFYSLYGPLFIVCHIGVSLASLGTFSALVWLTVDPIRYIPDGIIMQLGERAASFTNEGGKFVIAYGLHKIILPLRLVGSIYATRYLAPKITKLKFFRKKD